MDSFSMESFLKDISILTKQKEDEVTWSKTDSLLLKITEALENVEDVRKVFPPMKDLLLRSVLSDRSKLSGTALGLLKKIVDVSKGDIPHINEILPVLFKVCGRSNRIVSKRGQDAVVHLCKSIELVPYMKIIVEFVSSTNKNVRLSVFQGLEASFESRGCPKAFEKILAKGKGDPHADVRNIAKRIIEGGCCVKEPSKAEPIKRVPVSSSVSSSVSSTASSSVSTSVSTSVSSSVFNSKKTVPVVSHSPLKKVFKLENKVEKINAIEEKVKTIINPKANKTKVQKIIETYNTRDLLTAIPKKEKEVHDDLTPKKLDRFLSKYRTVYGNVLEEELKEENKEEDTLDDKEERVIENKEEDTLNDKSEDDKEDTLDDKEESVIENTQEDVNNLKDSYGDVLAGYSESLRNSEENIEGIVESYQKEQMDLERDVGSLSILDEEDLPVSSCKFDYTIVNSEPTKPEINSPEEEVVVFKHCPPAVDISSNRFSPLLFADKDECVIFDINKEDPKFKTPSNVIVKDKTFTSPLDVPVVKNSLSSSFLYSKDDSEDDFTQIDSRIYVDKKTFSRTEK